MTAQYKITLHEESFKKLQDYKAKLEKKELSPGKRLKDILGEKNISEMSDQEFLEAIVNTKIPKHFAEGLGALNEWNKEEFSILGDTIISFLDAQVYDNGVWNASGATIHAKEFQAGIFVIPGALLENGSDDKNTDYQEVIHNNNFNENNYIKLIERRILPSLLQASADAAKNGKKAVISIPGIGCGYFSGGHGPEVGSALHKAIQNILKDHQKELKNIEMIYLEAPAGTKGLSSKNIGGITLFKNNPNDNNNRIPQLTEPSEFMKKLGLSPDGKSLKLYKFIAGDHLSWPGNDQMVGSRTTDEGVAGAATDIIKLITGVEGVYDKNNKQYNPPEASMVKNSEGKNIKWEGGTWMQYINQFKITMSSKNTEICNSSGKFININNIKKEGTITDLTDNINQEIKKEDKDDKTKITDVVNNSLEELPNINSLIDTIYKDAKEKCKNLDIPYSDKEKIYNNIWIICAVGAVISALCCISAVARSMNKDSIIGLICGSILKSTGVKISDKSFAGLMGICTAISAICSKYFHSKFNELRDNNIKSSREESKNADIKKEIDKLKRKNPNLASLIDKYITQKEI